MATYSSDTYVPGRTLSQIHWDNGRRYEETAAGCATESGRQSILALAQREFAKSAAAALVEASA
jgi:hypothetical protein